MVGFEFDDGQSTARAQLALALFGASERATLAKPRSAPQVALGTDQVATNPTAA
jgi:hypothetical protein